MEVAWLDPVDRERGLDPLDWLRWFDPLGRVDCSAGSLLSIGSAGSIASALSFASQRSPLSARANDSLLGLPMGRPQRQAMGIGLVALGAAFLRG